jgi:hypothetical protein
MSEGAFAQLDPLDYPEWVGEPLAGAAANVGVAGGVDVGGDTGGLVGELMGMDSVFGAFMNATGSGAATFSQFEQSTARTIPGKAIDAFVGGYTDLTLGQLPFLAKSTQPWIPVADAIMGALLKRARVDFKFGDTAGVLVRFSVTGIEGLLTQRKEGLARLKAQAVMGRLGSLPKWIGGLRLKRTSAAPPDADGT